MKRFTETGKWNDQWFRKLKPEMKLLWGWLLDNCDAAGVIEPDIELASFQIGYAMGIDRLSELGDRITEIGAGKYVIPKFVRFQYGTLSKDCRAHGPVYASIEKNGLDRVFKGIPKGLDTPKDKYKDKDKEKDKTEGSVRETGAEPPTGPQPDPLEIPDNLKTQTFVAEWQRWMTFRRGMGKKPKDWAVMFREQLDWLAKMPAATATECLGQSIRNGWQGLFEPKVNGRPVKIAGQLPFHDEPVGGHL